MSSELNTVPLLEVRSLTKSFYGVKAVSDLTFSVQPGSVTGLIGPNGCGKSTTIDCITGFQSLDGGSVLLAGENITAWAPNRIAHQGLIRTFQNVQIYDDLSVLENLQVAAQEFDGHGWFDAMMGKSSLQFSEREHADKADTLLGEIGLSRYRDAPAGILSYGQKKLVALAASLMPNPSLVILDEPLAGVNPTIIVQIEKLIKKLNKAGQTFLIVEHNIDFIMRQCHRIVVMEAGHKLVEGHPDIVRNDDRVIAAYLGKRAETDEVENA